MLKGSLTINNRTQLIHERERLLCLLCHRENRALNVTWCHIGVLLEAICKDKNANAKVRYD